MVMLQAFKLERIVTYSNSQKSLNTNDT